MRTPPQPHKVLAPLLKARGLTYRQASFDTQIPYKKLLREGKTGQSNMTLDTAAVLAEYLGVNIAVFTSEKGEQR